MDSGGMFNDAVLKGTLASDLPIARGEILTFNSTLPLLEVFEELLDHGVLSAPVWDDAEAGYCGFLDLRDLVSYIVHEWDRVLKLKRRQQAEEEAAGAYSMALPIPELVVTLDDLKDLRTSGRSAVTLKYLARRHAFRAITREASLADVVELLGRVDHNKRVWAHRVPLVGEGGTILNVLSQSTLVCYLAEHLDEVGEVVHRSVGDLNIVTEPCISVPHNTSALDTLRVMDRNNLSGVALVDEEGKLVGNTSTSDLWPFFKLEVSLDLHVLEFVRRGREAARAHVQLADKTSSSLMSTSPHSGGDVWVLRTMEVTSCNEDDTLGNVLRILARTGYHRIWMVDEDMKPVGVISVSDICQFFAHLCSALD